MRVLRLAIPILVMLMEPAGARAIGDDNGGQNPDDPDTILAGVQYGTPPSSKSGKDAHQCTWTPAGETSTTDSPVVDVRVIEGQTQHLFLRSCPEAITRIWVSEVPPNNLGGIVTDLSLIHI